MVTFLVFLLVLFSFALVIGVPVVVASPGEWETSKSNIITINYKNKVLPFFLKDAENKLSYDLFYIMNYSIFLDIIIFMNTLRIVINRNNSKPL